jgi:hypothetical protein
VVTSQFEADQIAAAETAADMLDGGAGSLGDDRDFA